MDTLIDMTSGNLENQLVVFDSRFVVVFNDILRQPLFSGCHPHEVAELKSSVAKVRR